MSLSEAVADQSDANATAPYEGSAPSSAVLPGHSELSTATSNRRAYFRSVAQIGVQTASALSYAHGRGIIHRDIKPANLILDTTGNVWVTDFGLAKTGDGGVTHTGDILGTVRYMSPERFRGRCDVRADVYALGMTLYELLTLKPAYASGDRLKLIEQIRQSEAASPRSVDGRIPRDLETIVMKALDKDPKRRYQSADEMGEDLQRFVNDEPIKARRVGSVERLGRWCRRNPAVAGLLAAVLVLMAAGTAVSTWQAVVATRAREDLAAKNAELTDEQAKVEERFQMAQRAIALFHTGVSEDMLLKNPEFKELRTKLLRQAAGFYAELEKLLAGQTDAKSRKTLAEGYFQLAELADKIGDKKEALAVHRKALALRRELAAEGADVETRLDVARSLGKVGELLRATGNHAGALAAYEEERDLAERLEAEQPTDAVRSVLGQSHLGIGRVLEETGKPEEALVSCRKALAIQQKLADANPAVTEFQNDLAWSYHTIGWMLSRTGKPAEALTEFRKALPIWQKLADANPAVTEFQRDLAESHHGVGYMLSQTGEPDEALAESRQALAIWQKLADANPAIIDFQKGLAWSHHGIGDLLSQTGKREEALTEYRQALAVFQKLADANAAVTEFQRALARSHHNIGNLLSQTGKPEEALTELRQALAIFQKLADANPANPDFQNGLSWARHNLAWTLAGSGRVKEAFPLLETAVAADPKDLFLASQLAALQAWFGRDKELAATLERMRAVAKDTKDAGTAERAARACCMQPSTKKAELQAALALARKGVELDKGSKWREWRLLSLGMAEYRSGHYAAADEALLAAAKAGPSNRWVPGIAAFYRAMSLFRQGKEDPARQLALAAAATMKPLPKDGQNPLANNASHDDLILWLAYKEAKTLIQKRRRSLNLGGSRPFPSWTPRPGRVASIPSRSRPGR